MKAITPCAFRRRLYAAHTENGPSAQNIALDALAETQPSLILDAGSGWGELAQRAQQRTGALAIALDLSFRMTVLAHRDGLVAVQGDVQALPFRSRVFSSAIAAWMLYHVPALDRALGELARILVPGGRLVAITNSRAHLAELWALVDAERTEMSFNRENGDQILARHFGTVTRYDVDDWVTFAGERAVRSYFQSSIALCPLLDRLPPVGDGVRARRALSVFVADGPHTPTDTH